MVNAALRPKRLPIPDLGYHLCREWPFIFHLVKTPVCALYFVSYVTQQALELTSHQKSLKMIKSSPNNKCMRLRGVFTISGRRRSKTVTMCSGVIIVSVIMSAHRKVRKQLAYWLLKGVGEIPGYFCLISESKLSLVTQTLQPYIQTQRRFVSVSENVINSAFT